jgi:hypothetical protein
MDFALYISSGLGIFYISGVWGEFVEWSWGEREEGEVLFGFWALRMEIDSERSHWLFDVAVLA